MNGLLSRGSVVLRRRGDRILLTAPHPVTPGFDLSISWQRGAPRGTDDIPGALWTARCSPRGPAHLPRDPLATGLRSSSYPRNHGNRQRPGEGRAPGERPAQRPSFSLDTDRFFSAQEAGAVGSDNVPARAQGAGSCVTKRCGGLAAERRRGQPGAPPPPRPAQRGATATSGASASRFSRPSRQDELESNSSRRGGRITAPTVHQAQGCRAGVGGPRSHQQAEREAVSRWPGVAVQGHGHPRVRAGRTETHSVG